MDRERVIGIVHGLFMIYMGVAARGIPPAAKWASIGFGALSILRAFR